MKKGWSMFLLASLCALPLSTGCHVDADDDDDKASLKIDTKGDKKSVEIDRD